MSRVYIVANNFGTARALYCLRCYDETLAAWDAAIRLDPRNMSALNNTGHLLVDLDRYQEALSVFEQIIEKADSLIYGHSAYKDKGQTLYHLQRYEEALLAYEQALALYAQASDEDQKWSRDPTPLPWLHFVKGQALFAVHRNAEARTAYEQALILYPPLRTSFSPRSD